MAVSPDNTANITGTSVTTLTTPSFTITSAADRAAAVCFSGMTASASGHTSSCGGQSGAEVSGTPRTQGTLVESVIHRVINPASGTQTASMTWTGAVQANVGVITASGVDQTTPMNNGTGANGAATPSSLSVTTAAGDLTVAVLINDTAGTAPSAPSQTSQWATINPSSGGSRGGGGAGPDSHSWTHDNTDWCMSGANFVQSTGAAAPLVSMPVAGQRPAAFAPGLAR